jgi:hypothetical protein
VDEQTAKIILHCHGGCTKQILQQNADEFHLQKECSDNRDSDNRDSDKRRGAPFPSSSACAKDTCVRTKSEGKIGKTF